MFRFQNTTRNLAALAALLIIGAAAPNAHAQDTLVSWGYNDYGQVSRTPAGTFTAVASGGNHSVAIRTDGTLVSWGYNYDGQVSGAPCGTFSAVAAGYRHSVAIAAVPCTPTQRIQALKDVLDDLVAGGATLPGDGRSLQATLDTALTALAAGNTQGAIKSLNAFIAQVRAFVRTGRLTPAQGQSLIDAAQAIITALGG